MSISAQRSRASAGVNCIFGSGEPLDLHRGHGCWHWTDVVAAVSEGADPNALDIVRVFTIRPLGAQPGRVVSEREGGPTGAPQKARLDVVAPSWLVLDQSYNPGWRAWCTSARAAGRSSMLAVSR